MVFKCCTYICIYISDAHIELNCGDGCIVPGGEGAAGSGGANIVAAEELGFINAGWRADAPELRSVSAVRAEQQQRHQREYNLPPLLLILSDFVFRDLPMSLRIAISSTLVTMSLAS